MKIPTAMSLRHLRFIGINLGALGLFYVLLIEPFADIFLQQAERLDAAMNRLALYQAVAQREDAARKMAADAADPAVAKHFLQGASDGAIAAELQARLKRLATVPGVQVQSVRALEPQIEEGFRIFAAHLEMTGPIAAVYATLRAIEADAPYLFIRTAELRMPATLPNASLQQEPVIMTKLDVFGVGRGHARPR